MEIMRVVQIMTALCIALLAPMPAAQANDDALWREVEKGGYLLLMRHAQTVSGVGDPPGFTLADCKTQRNLSDEGRAQARRTGEAFRARGIALDAVRTSAWCRCVETAKLAFANADIWPALNSFFQGPDTRAEQTAAVIAATAAVKPPGNWMLVTHQVNITALTGEWVDSGQIVVARPAPKSDGRLEVVGKLKVQ